jgi:hypothetical protein
MNRRLVILGGLALGALTLNILGRQKPVDDPVVEARAHSPAAPASLAPTQAIVRPATATDAPLLIARGELVHLPSHVTRDLFAPKSWAPPPTPLSTEPVRPVAPPIPYTYLGKKLEDGHWEVYLENGTRLMIARSGETLEGQYRVESTNPPIMKLTYLPLSETQTMPIGDPQ